MDALDQLPAAVRDDLELSETPPIFDRERVLGYAFPIRGQGFWAPITGLLALSPDLSETRGIVFLEHSETPGLGGRITEGEFRDQFRPSGRANGRGLVLTAPRPARGRQDDDAPPARIAIDAERPSPGDLGYAQHVVAITGATGTSDAVEAFLNHGLESFYRAAVAAGLSGDDPGED